MKRAVYLSVVQRIEEQKVWDSRQMVDDLLAEFPSESVESLRSIVHQQYVLRAKSSYHYHNAPRRKAQLYQAVIKELDKNQGMQLGIINRLARERNFSPVLLARLVIEEHLRAKRGEGGGGGVDKVPKADVKALLSDPRRISDPRLGLEVKAATWRDDVYGPLAEAVKASVGVEHEERLKRELRRRGIPFKDEEDLRSEGYDKTPDVKLVSPVAVGGRVVNWVESKALFGDEKTHAEYIKSQLGSYWNRFGPGMVVYWCGFVEEITSLVKYGGVVVRDDFPGGELLRMDPFWDLKAEEEALFEEESDEDEEESEKKVESTLETDGKKLEVMTERLSLT